MTLNEWSSLVQIILVAITAVGIITSMYLSVKALREVQIDRKQRQKPHLGLSLFGMQVPIEFKKIPPRMLFRFMPNNLATKLMTDLPENAKCVSTKSGGIGIGIGEIINFGLGPALSVSINYIVIELEGEFDNVNLGDPIYRREFNRGSTFPSHILPRQKADIIEIPLFIILDIEQRIRKVKGIIEISCHDVFCEKHIVKQGFVLLTGYDRKEPMIQITWTENMA